MTRAFDRMVRATPGNSCPVCRKPDWCLVAPDGSAAICQRVESCRRSGEAGWLHVLTCVVRGSNRSGVRQAVVAAGPNLDFGPLADRCSRQGWATLQHLSATLGIPVPVLVRLRAGWHEEGGFWTFPMRDSTGRVVGIRARSTSGAKFCVTGSKEGCFFIPDDLAGHLTRLPVVEGPTDLATVLALGFTGVGRPSCSGGRFILRQMVKTLKPDEVVIFPDSDEPGRIGATRLANDLVLYCRRVGVTLVPPGHKDVRDAVRAGWSDGDIERAIETSSPTVIRFL